MADFDLTADFTDLQLLRRELLDLPKHAKTSASVFEREYNRVERQLRKTVTANQEFHRQLQTQNLANKSAADSASVFTRELAAQETQIDRLRSKYNPLYAAYKLYERTLDELNTAHEMGAISTAQHARQVELLKTEYQQFATGAAGAINRFTVAQNRSSRGMNAMGVGMQQAGYQIGDFLVQVQSGTNWMVAFGQQATQLVGILPMFNSVMGISGTALVGLSAGLGIVIPLATAFGAILMRSRAESNSATSGVVTFTQAMSRAREEISGTNQQLDAFNRGLSDVTEGVIAAEIRRIQAEIRLLEEEARRAEERNSRVGSFAPTPEGEGVEALRLEVAQEALAAAQEELRLLIQARDLERARTDMLDQQARAQELLLAGERARAELRQRDYASTQNMQAQIDLQSAILEHGEDSLEVAILRAEQDALSLRLSASGTREYVAQVLELRGIVAQQQAAVELEERRLALLQEVTEKTELLERTFESLFNTSADSLVAEIARVAEQLGIATDEALKLALALPIGHSGITGGRGTVGMPRGTYNPDRDLAIYDDDGRGGGGGASQSESIQDIIDAQIEQIRLERELLSLNEEQRRIREIALEIENAYQGEISETERTAINAAAQQIAQEERLRNAMQERIDMQERLADTISQSFGDAFMSMVDGTKSASEAFRGMAREIVAELFRILVVEQMVESIRGGLLGAFGGGGGGLFGRKASGGSMMAGQPYLVGERGPEIVVPGRSATVMNHNLSRGMGGGGTQNVQVEVFVNDNGNFDARVREVSSSVVSDAAPRIIQGAERQILDQRRRGGVYKATFG